MLVDGLIEKEVYNKLIEYILKKCDVISVRKSKPQHHEIRQDIYDFLFSKGYSKERLSKEFSKDLLEELFEKFEKDFSDLDMAYELQYELVSDLYSKKDFDVQMHKQQKREIESLILSLIYEYRVNEWLDKLSSDIVKERENYTDDFITNKKMLDSITYFIKINDNLEKELLSKNSFYNWIYPNSVEDISFFKNGYCWLHSVAHEKLCFIYCEDEEEYEYLKSIGIKFVDDKFISTSKEELYFENFLDN